MNPADTLVKGKHGPHGRRGLQRVLLGSDSKKVLRLSAVAVALVRPAG